MLRLRSIAAFSLVVSALYACGSSTDDGANGGNGGGGNGSLDGAFINTSGDGGNGTGDGAGGGGNCSAPVDMYVMFDRSGSMDEPQGDNQGDCNVGQNVNSKWCKAINALSGYFNSAGAKGQAAALQFFPLKDHDKDQCGTGDGYHVAALPPSGFVDLASNSFDGILNAQSPGGGTPTEAAIRGITRFTSTPANRRPGRVTIGVLITDGDPNGCNDGLNHLSGLLQTHYAATQIRTYVIGMAGTDFKSLEAIAQGGNAPPHPATVGALTNACGNVPAPCRHWNVGNGDPAAFIAAMAAIQASADGCAPGGGTVNPIPK